MRITHVSKSKVRSAEVFFMHQSNMFSMQERKEEKFRPFSKGRRWVTVWTKRKLNTIYENCGQHVNFHRTHCNRRENELDHLCSM
jgi:hypothetical protein